MSAFNSWLSNLFPTLSPREKLTILMPSGRIVRILVDEEEIEVDLGVKGEFGLRESFEVVGDELQKSLDKIREEQRVQR